MSAGGAVACYIFGVDDNTIYKMKSGKFSRSPSRRYHLGQSHQITDGNYGEMLVSELYEVIVRVRPRDARAEELSSILGGERD